MHLWLSAMLGQALRIHGHLNPNASPAKYMLLDAGLPQPDLVVCVDTPFSDVIERGEFLHQCFLMSIFSISYGCVTPIHEFGKA